MMIRHLKAFLAAALVATVSAVVPAGVPAAQAQSLTLDIVNGVPSAIPITIVPFAFESAATPPATDVSEVIRNGRGTMMAYKPSSMSDAELAAVVRFVRAIGRGEVKAQAKTELRIMGPASAVCGTGQVITPTVASCGGN